MSADHVDDETTRPPAIDLCQSCGCPFRPGWGMCVCGAPRPARLGGMGFIDPARVDRGQDAEDPATERLTARRFREACEQMMARPAQIITGPRQKAAYDWLVVRMQVLDRVLDETPRRRFARRYMLRRMLGARRLAILWPWAARKRSNLRWAWIEWKHRNDPEWQ